MKTLIWSGSSCRVKTPQKQDILVASIPFRGVHSKIHLRMEPFLRKCFCNAFRDCNFKSTIRTA